MIGIEDEPPLKTEVQTAIKEAFAVPVDDDYRHLRPYILTQIVHEPTCRSAHHIDKSTKNISTTK